MNVEFRDNLKKLHCGLFVSDVKTENNELLEFAKSLNTEIFNQKNTDNQTGKNYINTMKVILNNLDKYESAVAEHSIRVSSLAIILAKEMGLCDEKKLRKVQYSALLHDIGKIFIPDSIIKKKSKLTDEEMDEIKKHPQTGYDIVKTIPFLNDTANIILSHHERYDGKGYPRGLIGDNICIGARIFAVVDTYDAIVSDRCYRKAQSVEAAVEEINRCSGTQFDPKVINAFNNCLLEFVSHIDCH